VLSELHMSLSEMHDDVRDVRARPPRGALRHDWTIADVLDLFALPFPELLFTAQSIHRRHFDPTRVQLAQLLSIKTGGCPEDCGYCAQSAHFETGVKATKLMPNEAIVAEARRARDKGATRFCMGAAWRSPKDRDIDELCETVSAVKALGLETCMTLGMLTSGQAGRLKEAGLDYYNHNLDTSPEFYGEIITTRTYQDRLDTLAHVREAGMAVCCGGILGLGETETDRASLICTLANLPQHPESVPINLLMRVEGTPLAQARRVDPIDLVRTIAVARITMPASVVRLSAGREGLSDEAQALAFLAGANSIFVGSKLLTTPNPALSRDQALLARLGIDAETSDRPIRPT
jgi:biotin synthase